MELVELNETVNPGRPSNKPFKDNLEENLIPGITERLNVESKAEYTEDEIKKILNVDFSTENLYQQLKTKLLDTEIGVSIKRIPKNNKFVFFKRLGGMKRESDLFKINFGRSKPSIEKYLSENTQMGVEEKRLKESLDCVEYSTDNLYNRLRGVLSGTGMNVSIVKDVIEDGKKVNAFVFYNEKALEKERLEEKQRNEREKQEEIEREIKIKKEIEKENEEAKDFARKLANDGNLISELVDNMRKNPIVSGDTGIISELIDSMKKPEHPTRKPERPTKDVDIIDNVNEVVQCPLCSSDLIYEHDKVSGNNDTILECPKCGGKVEWTNE